MTGFDARDVEHLVGQLLEMTAGLEDVADLLTIRRRDGRRTCPTAARSRPPR